MCKVASQVVVIVVAWQGLFVEPIKDEKAWSSQAPFSDAGFQPDIQRPR